MRYTQLKQKLRQLQTDEREKVQKVDLLSYQIQEIEAARLQPGEEEDLQTVKKKMQNSARILDALHIAYALLQGTEESDGVLSMLDQLCGQMDELENFYPQIQSEQVLDVRYELEEVGEILRDALSDIEMDPTELERIEDRLDLIHQFKRKYGGSIEEILSFAEQAQAQLDAINHTEEMQERLEKESLQTEKKLLEFADQLSKKRRSAAVQLQKLVCDELTFLDMPAVRFMVHMETGRPDETGIDRMEFYISTNPGEPPKPLGKIASGGELSRIMLSLKNVIAEGDQIGTLIFDEVDTGVSGRAAQKIGRKLKQASENRQIICVTHLAQVAAFADAHLLIEKNVQNERTFTTVHTLQQQERVRELARIMGGENMTSTVLASAQELISQSEGDS